MLLGLALGVAAWIPIPNSFVQLPGPALATLDQVEVQDRPRPAGAGEYFITTLYRRPATAWWALRALIQSDWTLVSDSDGPPHSAQAEPPDPEHEVLRQVVYQTCGLEPKPVISILDTTPDSPLQGKVQAGDRLLRLDGLPITEIRQLRTLLQQVPARRSVRVELQDPTGRIYSVSALPRTIQGLPNQPGLGLLLSRSWDQSNLPPIHFKAGSYRGNSSDLVLGLDLCERLLAINLRRGRRIAGSGGLSVDGGVTSVQGLEQKLSSARLARAEVFFVPRQDLGQLSGSHAASPRIVAVDSLNDAINWLQGRGQAAESL